MNSNFTKAFKQLLLAEEFFKAGDKKTAKMLIDLAHVFLKSHK